MIISGLVRAAPSSAPTSPRLRQHQDDTLLASIYSEQRQVATIVGEVQKDVSEILRLLQDGHNRVSKLATEAELCAWSHSEHRSHPIRSRPTVDSRLSPTELIHVDGRKSAERGVIVDNVRAVSIVSGRTHGSSEESDETLTAADTDKPRVHLASLPYLWPRGLKIREGFEHDLEGTEKGANTIDVHGNVNPATTQASWEHPNRLSSLMDETQRADLLDRLLSRYMIDPSSRMRIAFNTLSLFVFLFNMLVIPYILAFQCVPPGSVIAGCCFTSSWWTFALALNFLTGYYSNGELVVIPGKVIKHYLRGWFPIDITLVIVDWIHVSRLETVGPPRFLWLLLAARFWKIVRAAEIFFENNFHDGIRSALRLLLFFTLGLSFNHWVACMWIWIGAAAKYDQGPLRPSLAHAWPLSHMDRFQWFVEEEPGSMCRIDGHVLYVYMTALHWSVAQFTLSGMDIICTNTMERFFTVVCQVFGMLAGSTLVSVLSAKLVEWQIMCRDQTNRVRQLQLFLDQQNVQRQIAVKVRRQVKDRQIDAKRLTEDDVPALKLLSSSMLQDLRLEIFRKYVNTHPLFRLWASLDYLVVTRLCSDSMDLTFQRKNDHLFQAGFHAEHMFFLVCGQLSYVQAPGFFEGEARPITVDKETWLCEAALWSDWIHVGKAEATMGSQTLRVSAEGVVRALDTHHLVHKVSREYCHQFHKRLTSALPPVASFPNDLHVPFTDFTDIVVSMKKSTQVTVGLHALTVAYLYLSRPWHVARGRVSFQLEISKLKHEIMNGESAVMLNGQGALERVVSVVALRIEREDGCILCQLWKMLNQYLPQPCCQLPGGKQKAGETSGDAVMRILSTKLSPLHLVVEVGKSVCQPEWKDSKAYGVRTKYMRTETTCSMRTSASVEGVIQTERNAMQNDERGMTEEHTEASCNVDGQDSLHTVESIDLVGRQVALMRDKTASCFYAWLTPSEFEYFRTCNGESELNERIPEIKRRSGFVSV